ncbi:MAG: type II toxin-antitoxin system mRNA interferase toxin, RelE/StbE family [Candidatus Diapherotrites archaeon]|nr:type II toxin-antitoxin system mRNA interferase toxin, RelE/StbE family [Candidatus Diapherotrites archaeon]
MDYKLKIAKELDKKLAKLAKKDKQQIKAIGKKVRQILKNPYHFKPLRGDMKGSRRVHVHKPFILLYEINEEKKIVRLLDYGHHDDIY